MASRRARSRIHVLAQENVKFRGEFHRREEGGPAGGVFCHRRSHGNVRQEGRDLGEPKRALRHALLPIRLGVAEAVERKGIFRNDWIDSRARDPRPKGAAPSPHSLHSVQRGRRQSRRDARRSLTKYSLALLSLDLLSGAPMLSTLMSFEIDAEQTDRPRRCPPWLGYWPTRLHR